MIHRYLDPGDTLAEVLFGLIMVLTFTVGAQILIAEDQLDAQELVIAAVGCNLAWGVIDAVLFMLGLLFQRSQRARFYRHLKSASNETEALAALQEEFGLEEEPLSANAEDRARLYQSMLTLSTQAKPSNVKLKPRDFVSAFVVFALVSVTAVPGVIPFLVIDNSYLALRVSNLVLVLLLFIVGYWWGRFTDARPLKVGLTVMLLGLIMVFVAVVLGG